MTLRTTIAKQSNTPGWAAIFLFLLLFNALAGSALGDSAISKQDFDKLSAEQKWNLVFSCLEARDKDIQNVTYMLRQRVLAVHDGVTEFGYATENELRRFGTHLWMRVVAHPVRDESGKIQSESLITWDGEVARKLGLPPYLPTPFAQGRIEASEPTIFTDLQYDELLGICMKGLSSIKGTVPFWVNEMRRLGREPKLEFEAETNLISVTVKEEAILSKTFWFDPFRGFVMVKSEAWTRSAGGELWTKAALQAMQYRQISGIWVPMEAIWTSEGSRAPNQRMEIHFTVDDFTIGTVTEKDVQVLFPKGTNVVDTRQDIAYVVNEAETYRLLKIVAVTTER
jgi:hypothetical protein